MKHISALVLASGLIVLSGCEAPPRHGQVFRGGIPVQEGPLDIQNHYSFRFVDKWRISHAWLSGPATIGLCHGGNVFKRLGGFGDLGLEPNAPLFERNGMIYDATTFPRKPREIKFSTLEQKILGTTSRDGKFEGYSSFCNHLFKDVTDGLRLFIVKPDPAKGTDEWVEGAVPVQINGLTWLHKQIPIRDMSRSREALAVPIEYWVLKIPETQYWMMLRFSSSTGAASKYGMGALHHPEKHQYLLSLFRRIVESVKLEPIEPVNIDHLFTEMP